MKRPNPALLVVLAAAAAVHLAVAALDFPTLARNGFLYDDSFYDFQIARHIAHGEGASFDGTHLTNGFQPLYVAMLVPMYWAAGSNETLPIHAALVLSALCSVASAYLLYRILARRVNETAAIVSAALWAFSPIVVRQAANGLETSLAALMFAATVFYYLENIRPDERVERRRLVLMGLLSGMCILARADLGFLVLAMGLDFLLVRRSRRAGHAWRGEIAAIGATALLVCLPWMAYGYFAVGSPFPESGRATRFLAIAYAPFFHLGPHSMMADGPTGTFVAEHFERSIETLKVIPALHPFFRGATKLGERLHAARPTEYVADAVGIVLLAGFALWWFKRRRTVQGRASREFEFLIGFAAMMIAAYSTFVFGVFFFLRYYYPVYFVGMIFAGIALHDAIAFFQSRSLRVRGFALAGTGVYAVSLLFMGYTSAFRSTPVYRFYDAAKWIKTHTDVSDTIGVFQSGAIGYLSGRRVINLDGKVNREAFAALREGKLSSYVRAAGIDVVMDSAGVIDLFLGPWSDAERKRLESERVFTGGEYGVPGWIGYRISPPRVYDASAPVGAAARLGPDKAP
ncbi:MAG TPA: glycosyltransferase family 39 protein [Candidatus Krumholzibacteria bacterium]|nr:glycosyltransferase family 39 protein [Candidatus Krumholzibacteria bacterium]